MQIIANKTGTTNKSEEKDLKQYLLLDSVDYINSINTQHRGCNAFVVVNVDRDFTCIFDWNSFLNF